MKPLPPRLEIAPLTQPPRAWIHVPGSKSITNRALVLAALSARAQPVVLQGALRSEDTEVMIACLRTLGFDVRDDWSKGRLEVIPAAGDRLIPEPKATLFVGNSGTTMRFLTAMVSLGQGSYRLDGVPRMRERPIQDLLAALHQLGVAAVCENDNGCPPVRIDANGWQRHSANVDGRISSQFLSGLMLAAPFAARETVLTYTDDMVSRPYLLMTEAMLREWGLAIVHDEATWTYRIPGGQSATVRHYAIEPDASAASYFFAAAAITGGTVWVARLDGVTLQGDVRFVELLRQMGCRVEPNEGGLVVQGRPLHGIDADMNDISDTVMTLAAVACFADGPTTIRNVAHIRHKETDRLHALAVELRKLGAEVTERSDGLTIVPRPLRGTLVDTYKDHRMAMSLALVGLRVPGVVIDDPGCVAKTYPDFFADLEKLQ